MYVRKKHTEKARAAAESVPPLPEGRCLFAGPDRAGADRSIPNAMKYVVDHFCELFGTEVRSQLTAVLLVLSETNILLAVLLSHTNHL